MTGLRRTALVLVAWTAFVWLTRVRNVLGDDDLSAGGRVGGLALAGSLLVLAGVVLAAAVAHRPALPQAVRVLAAWTVVVWAVRSVQIATAGHGAAFVAVHLVLGVVSVALAVVAARAAAPAAVDQRAP